MATMCSVLLCLLLANLALAQNSTSLEDRFAALEREFAFEKASLRSELKSTKDDLEITRSQLRITRSQLLDTRTEINAMQPTKINDAETTNLDMEDEHSNMQTSDVFDWNKAIKSRALSQILDKWVKKATTILTKPCEHAQGDHSQTKQGPELPIALPKTAAQNQPISSMTLSEPRRRSRRNADSQQVTAFHAELGIPAENLRSQQAIIFDSSTLNIGLGYKEDSGIFVCPEAGIYYFTVTIMVFPQEKVETEMVINGDQVLLAYSAGTTGFNQGTSSTVVRLEDGDLVWVRILDNPALNTGVNIRVMGGGWSTFTGYKIK
ncbi:uncharacterized protein LOC110446666 [Mizuhopecten yessoensis]|uniref:Heavy metal-binding protein HIP n=1 Tax=Mizuhopecten yessoensis TaxID=6573 RepID=A0A210QWS7_MIZYE|nr:uncharacterized protein LOC110446666 [Mizuhopecten yessoensis]OWF53198.1 Heavy metal-binding protein HIP [Mizuhopecten yessoensis]